MAVARGSSAKTRPTRGPRKGPRRRLLEVVVDGWGRLLDQPAVWGGILLLVGTWCLTPSSFVSVHPVVAGSIAGRDYVAPRDLLLLDQEATAEKERRAEDEVLPVYDLDSAMIGEREQEIAALFAAGRGVLEKSPKGSEKKGPLLQDVTAAVEKSSDLKLPHGAVDLLLAERFSADLEDRLRSLLRQALNRGVVANKDLLLEHRMRGITLRDLASGRESTDLDLYVHLGYPEEVRDFLEAEVRDWAGFSASRRRTLVAFLLDNITPNLLLNRSETLLRRNAAAAAVDRSFIRIRKGQVIVRQGDEISATAARAIAEMAGERSWRSRLFPFLGTACLLALAIGVTWLGVRPERRVDRSHGRQLSEHLLLLASALLGAKLALLMAAALSNAFETSPFNSFESYLFAVPFASLALVATLLCGRNAALLSSFLFAILAARMVSGDAEPWNVVLYAVAGSLAAVYALDQYRLKQRLVMTRVGLLVGLVNILMIVVQVALAGGVQRGGVARLGFDLLLGAAGGILAAAVASFALPILESVLAITTDIKLVELSNTNLPLLRRLAFEAPGTFQHSLMVANLAKEGCEAIEADATLAYAGALYHDVGKVFRPEYFIENQRYGKNPHDKLAPSMSALILISHVKDGLELARREHLPRPILDAIEQHHGTRLIKFFYSRAQDRSDPATGGVAEEKFRYPGPKPRSKVMGVLMLADGVEAASRTLAEPTPQRLRSVVRAIMEDCLSDGQLDRTDLTLADLRRVSEAFLRVLANIYHHRVDYPGFDFNADPRERRAMAEARAS